MFSQTVEYALRAVVQLAYVAPEGCTTKQLSKTTRVPLPYLSKVVQALVRAEIVQSRRGLGGGIKLAVAAEDLSILDVVNAVDPIQRIQTCPLDLPSHGANLCPLHRRMDSAIAHVEEALGKTTLAEVLSEKTDSPPLCEIE